MTEQFGLERPEGYLRPLSMGDSATQELLAQVGETLSQYQLFASPSKSTRKQSSKWCKRVGERTANQQPVVVGVSGGADSIGLLYVLHSLADVWGIELHIAHLNHNLRTDAEFDAQFVACVAAELCLPCHLGTVPQNQLQSIPGGVESAARTFRYRYLCATARHITPSRLEPIVVVAHHANDQAETILLNLTRGSGLRGLNGMDWITYREGVRIVRPLLNIPKDQILAYLRANNLTWVEDSTNQDQNLFRNRLRHTVIPILEEANPQLIRTLGRTAEVIRAESERIERFDRAALRQLQLSLLSADNSSLSREPSSFSSPSLSKKNQTALELDRIVLDLVQLLEYDLATQRNIIRLALEQLMAKGLRDIDFETTESLLNTLQTINRMGITHPLIYPIAWTVGRIGKEQSIQLSIHKESALPFEPAHPLLDRNWQRQIGSMPVPRSGVLSGFAGWNLRIESFRAMDLPAQWKEKKDEWSAFLDADQVKQMLLTVPAVGQRFAPIGLNGQHKSLGDLFTDRKILRAFRNSWPIIIEQDANQSAAHPAEEVLWVCGLQLAHHVRITDVTQNVLHLSWERSAK
ncbi:MAG: tRNA lysidine(34) synthetase TilS [Chloroflexota bacterium]